MKKQSIINFLKEKLDENREYEFWFNDNTGEFGGGYFFRTMQKQIEFEQSLKDGECVKKEVQ